MTASAAHTPSDREPRDLVAEVAPIGEAQPSEPRQLAIIRDYDGLHRALRDRIEQLNISRIAVDDRTGWASGYAAKVFSPKPMKHLSVRSIGEALQALGVRLLLEEDPEAMERTRSVEKRQVQVPLRALRWGQAGRLLVSKRWVKRIAAEGGRARARALSPAKRRALARRAARARWSRPKLVEMKNGHNRK